MKKLLNVKKSVVFMISSFNTAMVNAQKIETITSVGMNIFFDLGDNAPYNKFLSSSDPGFFFGIGVSDVKFNDLPHRFILGYESFCGYANARSGGLGGGTRINAELKKSLLSLEIYPFKIEFLKNFEMNIGMALSFLIQESFSGTITTAAGNSPTTTVLQEERNAFNSMTCLGLKGSIQYKFSIYNSLSIFPFYAYYFGLTDEFKDFPKDTKAMRHYLSIGLRRNL